MVNALTPVAGGRAHASRTPKRSAVAAISDNRASEPEPAGHLAGEVVEAGTDRDHHDPSLTGGYANSVRGAGRQILD